MFSSLESWKSCKEYLQNNVLSDCVYQKWINPIQFLGKKESEIILGIPKEISLEEFSLAYLGLIKNYFDIKVQKKIQIKIKQITQLRQKSSAISSLEAITNTYLEPLFSFEHFIFGNHAEFACKASLSICNNLGRVQFNPLFISAKHGLGKTHLLQAIGNAVQLADDSFKVRYVDATLFYNDFLQAIDKKNQKGLEFSKYYTKDIDLLLFDDVHHLASKMGTQEEFFHIFNALYQSKKQIVLTSLLPIQDLDGIEERLLGRFQSGVVVNINTPNQETREKIVRKKLQESYCIVENKIIVFIAEQIKESIPYLSTVVKQMILYSSLGRKITLEVVCRIVQSIIGDKKNKSLTSNEIITIVCHYLEVNTSLVLKEMRGNKKVVEARQISMYFIQKQLSSTLKTIGMKFGNRDYSTVKKSIEQVQKKINSDQFFCKKIETIFQKIDVL